MVVDLKKALDEAGKAAEASKAEEAKLVEERLQLVDKHNAEKLAAAKAQVATAVVAAAPAAAAAGGGNTQVLISRGTIGIDFRVGLIWDYIYN